MHTEQELAILKKRLEKEQADIIAEMNHLEEPEAVDMGDDKADPAGEEADKMEELETDTAINVDLKGRLDVVKATLFKIEHGKFGFCEKCGAEIEKDVLDVDPESRWCKQCKLAIKI